MQYSSVQELYQDIYPKLMECLHDNRLYFDLDMYNILNEIRDVYAGYPEQTIDTVNRVVLLAYAMYWNKISAGQNQNIDPLKLELMGDLIAASVYHLVDSNNATDQTNYELYESRWEGNETVEFLLHTIELSYEEAMKELEILNYSEPHRQDIWELYCTLKEAIRLANCRTEAEYYEEDHQSHDSVGIDIFEDLERSMRQPGWFIK